MNSIENVTKGAHIGLFAWQSFILTGDILEVSIDLTGPEKGLQRNARLSSQGHNAQVTVSTNAKGSELGGALDWRMKGTQWL